MDLSGISVGAHRGLRLEYPDNTLEGILAAKAVADIVETDVRCTSDGIAVLSHDPEIGGLLVGSTEWTALAGIDVGDGHTPARFSDMLEAIGSLPLDIEIKNDPDEPGFDPVFSCALQVAAQARPQDIVTSFHWPTMDALKRTYVSLTTGLLVGPGGSLEETRRSALQGGHSIVAPHWSLLGDEPTAAVQRMTRDGLRIVVWTVDDEERAKLLASAGVSVIITDDPRRIGEALRRIT